MSGKKSIADSVRNPRGKKPRALAFFLSEHEDEKAVAKDIRAALKEAGIDIPVVVLPPGVSHMEIIP